MLELKTLLASNAPVDGGDVRRVKRALNWLGYYMPDEKVGLSDTPDRALFDAIRQFQSDHDLSVTGEMRPGDEVVEVLDAQTASGELKGQYVWKTMQDSRVRGSHAAREGQVMEWGDHPHPGEEENCRCWATAVDPCIKLSVDLQNEQLDLERTLKKMNEADRQAKQLRKELDDTIEGIKKAARESGIDLGGALIPGVNGRLPSLSIIIEIGKAVPNVGKAVKKYLDKWNALNDKINEQVDLRKEAEELREKIRKLREEMEKAGCDF